jgi:hypothetical protein
MNWLAKINLNIVFERLGPFKSALMLLTIIVISLFVGYRLGNFYHGFQQQKITQQIQQLDSIYQKQLEQVRHIHTIEVELTVEKLANERSMALLKQAEQEHFEVKKKLAFYEKVMSPEKHAAGLFIDGITIMPMESPHHFRFQVALVKQERTRNYSKGYIDIAIKGSQNGKPMTIPLSDISQLDKKALSFNFKYFQIVEGVFTLSDNFTPEQVILSAIVPKTRWQKAQRLEESYEWLQVVK